MQSSHEQHQAREQGRQVYCMAWRNSRLGGTGGCCQLLVDRGLIAIEQCCFTWLQVDSDWNMVGVVH